MFLFSLKGCETKLLQTSDVIKNLRIKNNYTQTELAEMLGLKLSTLQKYESGSIVNLKLETLRELCFIFQVPPIALVFPSLSQKEKDGLILLTIKDYTELNDVACKKVCDYIQDLRKIPEYRK